MNIPLAKSLETLLEPIATEMGQDIVALYRLPKTLAINFYHKLIDKNVTTEKIVHAISQSPTTTTKILKICDNIKTQADDYVQQLFAEIMASEIMEEGSYSLETIHRLSLMTRKELEYFYENIAPFCFAGNGFFQLASAVSENALISDLDVAKYGLVRPLKEFDSGDEKWYLTDFSNGDKFLIQGKNVSKMNLKMAVLTRFGQDLCKLGVAENKIRKWTPEDKQEILRVCKHCGIDEIDVKFDV
jgi:hypothetical protein